LDNGIHIVRHDVDVDSKPESDKPKWSDFGGNDSIVGIAKGRHIKRNFTTSD
jgi:hypothetical protein